MVKTIFSKSWNASTQPRKQRKYRYNIPEHSATTFLHSRLSKELSKKHKTRNIRVRKGDSVKIMRGQFKGKTGTVEEVNTKDQKIYIAGIEQSKKDGSKSYRPLHPSNLIITELAKDSRRFKQKNKTIENKERKNKTKENKA